nr:reverse transcriptase domain-containing protein [Tanacetum cinerariifolium]
FRPPDYRGIVPAIFEWSGGPIAPIAIQETNFGLKNDMIQQVHNYCQFHGLSGDDANKHLDKSLHVTQSIKVNGVTDDTLRLYLFLHSLTHHATAWFDRLPRNSINTFEQMAKVFLGKYFPPSMVTKLRNEITNFRQRPDESLFKAWERYKFSIARFPNHNMFPVTQIDTFYNGLTLRHRDTINAAAGGTFMKRRLEECYDLIKNMTAHHNDWDTSAQRSESSSSITSSSDTEIAALKAEMAKINKNLMRVLQVNQQVKAVTPSCETCGGPHSFNDCPSIIGHTQNVYDARAYQGNFHPQGNNQGRNQFFQGASHGQNPPPAYQASAYQALVHQPQIPQSQVVTTNEFTNFMKANDAILKNMQTNMTSLTNSDLELKNMFGQFMKMNTALSSGLRTLLGNTITNPKEELQGITTHSGTAYQGPTIPTTSSSQPLVVERETEPIIAPIIELVAAPVRAPKPNQRLLIPYPSRLHDQKLRDKANGQREFFFQIFKDLNFNISFADAFILMPKRSFLKTGRALIDVFEGELTIRVGKEAITFNLDQTSRYSANYNDMMTNRIEVIDMACEEYSQEVLSFFDVIASGNPTPYYDPIVSTTFSTLTSFRESDFLLEEVDAFLALEDDLTSPEVDQSYVDIEEDIILLEELKICEAKSNKSSIDEPLEVELKDLPPHLEYVFLEGDDKFPIIIAKDLSDEEKTALIMILKSYKRAIAWKLSDIKGINPKFCTHKILVEDDFKPTVQHQRRVNPKIHDVIKNEEKSHFMVKEGIVLGHKISKNGIEVDKAKVDVIAKLPHPTTIKGIRSFLGHAGFYRRFIKDFSKIARLMTRLHEKDTPFIFFKECIEAFQTPKGKLTKAPILIALDWDLTFEIMCDASDFAIGAVLGQRQEKHFRPISYASKTMIEASNYTTTEKEMLAVVYAFEKFWSYLIINKSIVYTGHSAFKYLSAKKDSNARLLL